MPNYVYPPRPKGKIYPAQLPAEEKKGVWVAQRKFNGTRSPIRVTADRQVFVWGRHGEPHKQFEASKDLISQVLALDLQPDWEYWLDGEVLNNKTSNPAYKDKIVLFDLIYMGKKDEPVNKLFGMTNQLQRLALLTKICRFPTKLEPANGIALAVSNNIWMAETWDADFVKHYQEKIDLDEIEGLFLRNKKSVIDNIATKEYECTWCVRCRKPHKNYDH